MTFIEALRSSHTKIFNFTGRARRKEYFYTMLCYAILITIASFILNKRGMYDYDGFFVNTNGFVIQLVILLPTLSLCFRRLQDVGVPGFLYLLPFASFLFLFIDEYGWYLVTFSHIAFYVMYLYGITIVSNPKSNRYGDSPKTYENEVESLEYAIKNRKRIAIIGTVIIILIYGIALYFEIKNLLNLYNFNGEKGQLVQLAISVSIPMSLLLCLLLDYSKKRIASFAILLVNIVNGGYGLYIFIKNYNHNFGAEGFLHYWGPKFVLNQALEYASIILLAAILISEVLGKRKIINFLLPTLLLLVIIKQTNYSYIILRGEISNERDIALLLKQEFMSMVQFTVFNTSALAVIIHNRVMLNSLKNQLRLTTSQHG
ncbi:Uncharacterized membrane protein YhaH, DUF805 family [Pseudobutyrivibrio sp. YE44]|uniref:DUF805 domain-containing protein n=1 Tax=Pseudobutyrivibrio sp. YE44 TaxID=1520802 RepID=UPI00088E151C|nr:DUF805 domain-containing protein [Pseudobutyrivibrio sp. YE44]SDB24087.1 Uncharacterized membrane protein YhaH, DUF805 family [Pseudobutyrivibrio sp. YE44]